VSASPEAGRAADPTNSGPSERPRSRMSLTPASKRSGARRTRARCCVYLLVQEHAHARCELRDGARDVCASCELCCTRMHPAASQAWQPAAERLPPATRPCSAQRRQKQQRSTTEHLDGPRSCAPRSALKRDTELSLSRAHASAAADALTCSPGPSDAGVSSGGVPLPHRRKVRRLMSCN